MTKWVMNRPSTPKQRATRHLIIRMVCLNILHPEMSLDDLIEEAKEADNERLHSMVETILGEVGEEVLKRFEQKNH